MSFIRVFENIDSEPVEIPIEDDGTVLYTTLSGQFPKVCGLKYRPLGSITYRAVKLLDGKLYKPPEGWSCFKFICVFAKETDNKRKCDETYDNCLPKTKRLEGRKCTDLIVLNLGWKVDEEILRKYFTKFGELVLVQVKRDRESNQSKGFAFVRFLNYESQVLCLAEQHLIDGRWCAVKVPFSKNEADKQEISKKVHVAYTSEDISMDDLRAAFKEYGYVTDIFIPKPFRNFAFVTFDSSDSVQSLIGRTLTVKGHTLTIGSAVPKINNNKRMGLLQFPTYGENNQGFSSQFGWPTYDNGSTNNPYKQRPSRSQHGYSNYNGMLPTSNQQYILPSNRHDPLNATYGPHPNDMGQNTAAMAALNILNNPNVVAAIVAAANKSNNGNHKFSYQQGGIQ